MKNKLSQDELVEMVGKVFIKFVKKAKMWVKTTFPDGKQKQEWFSERPIISDDNNRS